MNLKLMSFFKYLFFVIHIIFMSITCFILIFYFYDDSLEFMYLAGSMAGTLIFLGLYRGCGLKIERYIEKVKFLNS